MEYLPNYSYIKYITGSNANLTIASPSYILLSVSLDHRKKKTKCLGKIPYSSNAFKTILNTGILIQFYRNINQKDSRAYVYTVTLLYGNIIQKYILIFQSVWSTV